MKQPNQRAPSQALADLLPTLRANWRPLWEGLLGYLTLPGLLLAVLGMVVGWRRHRAAAGILGVWTAGVLVSALLLPLTEYPRYFATAVVPLSGFAAIGALAGWDAIAGGSWASAARAPLGSRRGRSAGGARRRRSSAPACSPIPRMRAIRASTRCST